MTTRQMERLYQRYLIPVYNRLGIAAARGKGSWLWDSEGKRYLDFFPGWGVNALGHCHPEVVKAVKDQVGRLIHVANTYYHEPQARLAEALVKACFKGKAFFTNSGAEAVEAAIKLARRFGHPDRWEIITMENSFHGRTLGAMAATGQGKVRRWFKPIPSGFRHVPFNRLDRVRQAIGPKTVAIMVEPIQGEGGIHVATPEFLKGLRRICDRHRLLLIFDEISTGMGRTGTLFCFQQYRVTPDLLLLAKPAAGGLPLGVLIARRAISDLWEKASHATTFGGNPLVTAAGLATLRFIQSHRLAERARRKGEYLIKKLQRLKDKTPLIKEVRGRGLMIGIELNSSCAEVVKTAARMGLLLNCTQERVLRMYPPLTVTKAEIDVGIKILDEVFRAVSSSPAVLKSRPLLSLTKSLRRRS